jgi:hypothetical protein
LQLLASCTPWILRGYIAEFIQLVGEDRWNRRLTALRREAESSHALSRIISDYHWIEFTLTDELRRRADDSVTCSEPFAAPELAQRLRALRFARNAVEFFRTFNVSGQTIMRGRLRDALKSAVGYLPLAQELEFASFGIKAGYRVSLPDFLGDGRQDVRFHRGPDSWFAECKFLSADAGRKITRRDFYRLVAQLENDLRRTAHSNAVPQVIVVTLTDRLSPSTQFQMGLTETVREFMHSPSDKIYRNYYTIEADGLTGILAEFGSPELEASLKAKFGSGSHVFGALAETGNICFLVVRSEKADDASKPILEALRSASIQSPRDSLCVVSLHLQGICSSDLLKKNFQQRMLLLTNYFYFSQDMSHVCAVHVAPAGEVSIAEDVQWYQALSLPNPMCSADLEEALVGRALPKHRVRTIQIPWA